MSTHAHAGAPSGRTAPEQIDNSAKDRKSVV